MSIYIQNIDKELNLRVEMAHLYHVEREDDYGFSLWQFWVTGDGVDATFYEYGSCVADAGSGCDSHAHHSEPVNKGSVKLTGDECWAALREWFDNTSVDGRIRVLEEILDGAPGGTDEQSTIEDQLDWLETARELCNAS